MMLKTLRAALTCATALTACPGFAQSPPAPPATAPTARTPSLEEQFQNPPNSARPRVWWHWMNGNITKDGIAKDMAWMKRVGIGGLQNFDASLQTPQIVDKRLVYMTPEWKDAFRFAATEADRLGLELAIASSPGWSETGGPWVKPEDGLKKLVWSETEVIGGKRFVGKLAAPPAVTGPFQSLKVNDIMSGVSGEAAKPAPTHYADVAVLAYPLGRGEAASTPKVTTLEGAVADPAALFDADLDSGIKVGRGTADKPGFLAISYATPRTIRSATLFTPDPFAALIGSTLAPRLEASNDGRTWRTIAAIATGTVPTTVSFAPVTARHFRVVLAQAAPTKILKSDAAPGAATPDYKTMLGAMVGKAPVAINQLVLSPEARVDRFQAKAGFSIEPDYYALSVGLPDEPGVPVTQVIDLTGSLRPDGTLDWTPPTGRWRVVRLGYSLLGTTNHPAPPEATGLEVDKFDSAAVHRYIEHYLDMYKDAAGSDLIGKRGVRALLTDSIEVGAANWTPRMVEQFKHLRGYDPTPWLPALTGTIVGSRGKSDKFLYDYRRTLADLMASEHYGTIAKVAHENDLKVYGEALEDRRPSLGDDMAMRSHADIPMAAMWMHSRANGPKPTYLADIKGAASVAHIYGQNLVAAESMTASLNPWNYAPNDLKRVIDLEFVTGVNRPVIHTSVHVPVDDKLPGLSLFIFGQYFNRNETWAEMAKPWVDYISRNALMLQQGRNVADVAYFYGEEAPLTGLYGESAVADAPKSVAFDFVNADALMGALTNDGTDLATPGGARYRALYLGGSSRKMTLGTLRKLATLVEGGATVVGMRPDGNPSLAGDGAEYAALAGKLWAGGATTQVGKGQVIASNDIDAALTQIGVTPDFRFTGGQDGATIPFLHRKLDAKDGGGDSYFLVNRKERSETIEARFRVTGKAPELWHAETGRAEALGYRIENGETVVPLTLAGEESVHVVFRKPARGDALAIKKVAPAPLAHVGGPWTIRFQPGRGAPASTVMTTLRPLDENADPGIKYFSGIATYATALKAPAQWHSGQPLWLDLGDVREIAEVLVNGKSVGYTWHAPYRVEVGSALHRGTNKLEVRVADLWVNRLIGDAQPGAKKLTWTPLPTYRADAPLRRSGLIGPVELLGIGGR